MPTPPPDIDVEDWERSIARVAQWSPTRLCLTHFGSVDEVDAHLELARDRLRVEAEWARPGSRERFLAEVEAELDAAVDSETAKRFRQAAPPEQLWLGLERYWRKRAERGLASSPSAPPG
jgi:hypothetical protein